MMSNTRKRKSDDKQCGSTKAVVNSLGLADLHKDILLLILNCLNLRDLINISLVSHGMNGLVQLTNEYLRQIPEPRLGRALSSPEVAITVLQDADLIVRFLQDNSPEFFATARSCTPTCRRIDQSFLDRIERLHIHNSDVRALVPPLRGKSYPYSYMTERMRRDEQEKQARYEQEYKRFKY